jgi:hypothetical protein
MGESRPDTPDAELTDRTYRALSNADRRLLLAALSEQDQPQPTLAELVEVVTEDPTPTERDQSLLELHHVHLPMLDEAGILTYDADQQRVVQTDGDHRVFSTQGANDSDVV